MKTKLFCFLAIGFFLTACGPEQSAVEKDDQQRNETIKKKTSLYEPLNGVFVGTYKDKAKDFYVDASLKLSFGDSYTPINNENSPIPTLQGTLTICEDRNPNCLREKDVINERVLSKFSLADYRDGNLTLIPSSQNNPGYARFIGKVENSNHITGKIYDSRTPDAGTLDVTKVQP